LQEDAGLFYNITDNFLQLNSISANAGLRVANMSYFGSVSTPTSFVDITQSTSSISSLRIRDGVTVTLPNNGDI
jgi:hypothetical protein